MKTTVPQMQNENAERKIKKYSHRLLETTRALLNILMQLYIKNELREKPHITKKRSKQAHADLDKLLGGIQRNEFVESMIVFDLSKLVKRFYENIFVRVIKGSVYDLDPNIRSLIVCFRNPNSRYLKFILLTHILAVLLDNMDFKARYPLSDYDYQNISLLMRNENKQALKQLISMLDSFVILVPAVCKQIDLFALKS
jgi:hypothetical protein